jgi:cytochrome c oxidase accessory protein FixG
MTTPQSEPSFKDSIPTVDAAGKRVWMYPRKPPCGKKSSPDAPNYYTWRTRVSWVLLFILVIGPFVKINGNPLLMMNFLERKFSIFGIMFWPQDFPIFALGMITLFVMIVFFTAAFGRIWCGWLCPQTVLMEMVFRKIEYFIEGDANAQKALNARPWDNEKVRKKVIKHSIFFGLSFVVANLLLGYIIGGEDLIDLITDPPNRHVGGLFAMLLFTGLFYAIFARFREQACTFVCPYGRFQSVLLDNNSIIVAYDHKRGEERARKVKGQTWEERLSIGKGDCVDCGLCVTVCPTGIDIRNGTQMECVNCCNCIDACNSVMHKVGRDPGLIRITSEDQIEGRSTKIRFTPRLKTYGTLLAGLLIILTVLLIARNPLKAEGVRAPGSLYQQMPNGSVMNIFQIRAMNKTNKEAKATLELIDATGQLLYGQQFIMIPPQDQTQTTLVMTLPPESLDGERTKVKLGLRVDGKIMDTFNLDFQAPKVK